MPVQIDDHPPQTRPYAINQIADSLLVDRAEILEVLDRGTELELRAHLRRYTQAELKPLHIRKDQAQPKPFPFAS